MSARQLGALSDRFGQRQRREDILVGILAAVNANYSFHAPQDEAKQPWDFVPTLQPPAPPERTEDEIAAHFDALFAPYVVRAEVKE